MEGALSSAIWGTLRWNALGIPYQINQTVNHEGRAAKAA